MADEDEYCVKLRAPKLADNESQSEWFKELIDDYRGSHDYDIDVRPVGRDTIELCSDEPLYLEDLKSSNGKKQVCIKTNRNDFLKNILKLGSGLDEGEVYPEENPRRREPKVDAHGVDGFCIEYKDDELGRKGVKSLLRSAKNNIRSSLAETELLESMFEEEYHEEVHEVDSKDVLLADSILLGRFINSRNLFKKNNED